jgi:predicted ATPase
MRVHLGAVLAQGLASLGRPEAWEACRRNAEVAEQGSEIWCLPEVHRLTGDVLALTGGDAAEVEAAYRRALATAAEQGARSWELRAATSLARLWRRQGRPGEARELLAPIFGWFTEGFDTADLKEAGSLLDEL